MRLIRTALLALLFCCGRASAAGSDAPAAAPAPRPSTASPNVHILAPMTIPGLDRQRTIRLYLPPDYAHSNKRYPVLYMHDGQNLFDAATSFLGEWEVDETLDALATTRRLQIIVVGIDNGGVHRMQELNAWDNAEHGKAEGRAYMDFIVKVVKPYIDARYRTRPDRAHTAIMGSSLGGLISHYAIYAYPKVFGRAGIFSPAYWYAPAVFDYTSAHALPPGTKLYFYAGGREDENMVGNMERAVALIRGQGLPQGNIEVHVDPAAQHNEIAWRAEFPRAVQWLFDDVQ
ncbi:MAG TPA: alpha/beta hydrolase-fold protein [Rudaea sp.]|nr:alpha/beta hydrolase-fold protein [Rudaea sp.]